MSSTARSTPGESIAAGAEPGTWMRWIVAFAVFATGVVVLIHNLGAGAESDHDSRGSSVTTRVRGAWVSHPYALATSEPHDSLAGAGPLARTGPVDFRDFDRGSEPAAVITTDVSPNSPSSSSEVDLRRRAAAAQPALRAARKYKVVAGDSLWRIAERELGDGLLWARIREANPQLKSTHLVPGTELQIPSTAASARSTALSSSAAVASAVHVVADGETLYTIARKYRPGRDWNWLYADNRKIVTNPNRLRVGTRLAVRLPR